MYLSVGFLIASSSTKCLFLQEKKKRIDVLLSFVYKGSMPTYVDFTTWIVATIEAIFNR